MPHTVELPDDLAASLSAEAARRGVSLADYALSLLASGRPDIALPTVGSPGWGAANARRMELIRKKNRGGLSVAEAAEYQDLQARMDAAAEAACPPKSLPGVELLDRIEAEARG